MKTERYKISGMACAACSASVERVVKKLDGVNEVTVNLIMGVMTVSYDQNKLSPEDFLRTVQKAGFGIEPFFDSNSRSNILEKKKSEDKTQPPFDLIIAAISGILLLYISMGQMLFKNLPIPDFLSINTNPYNFAIAQLILCLPALYCGKKFFKVGFGSLIRRNPNMDTLVAIGSSASLLYSIVMTFLIYNNPHAVHSLYYESAAMIIVLIRLGKFLEENSRKKTKNAIESLMALSPDYSIILKDGKQIKTPTNEVNIGDILLVRTGDKIPLDGIILEGNGSIDESMLTGESMPVEKQIGDAVTGGSLNIDGLFCIKVTHTGSDTTLAKIIKFVEEAQGKKAPISKVADKVSGIFVPIVMAIAFISALIWIFIKGDFAFALKIFTSVLVVACPCALGLATPTAIMVGTGLGARNGILIRNGEVLETLNKTKVCVFDKTGTLTKGKPSVTDVVSKDKDTLLRLALAVESVSTHPLARAVTEYAQQSNIPLIKTDEFKNIGGMGIKAVINEQSVLVGNLRLMQENEVDTKEFDGDFKRLSSEGKSLIFVAQDKQALGILAVADTLKTDSVSAINRLKNMNIKTVLLSGDNKTSAEYIAKKLSMDEVYFEVLPEQKAEIIDKIKQKYGTVIMVGDGINDAPALSAADIGCAIGNGSDIAIESADLVLMKSNPTDVASAVLLSRMTLKNIKENLFWAFCYNTICIPIAVGILYPLGILMSPMFAAFAMSLSSVCVVSNALRLRHKKIK